MKSVAVPFAPIIAQGCRTAALTILAAGIVAMAHRWPEMRLPIVSWLLIVALLWRPTADGDR